MRFVMIGAGGIGGWLLRGLAAMTEYSDSIPPESKTIVVVDGDGFEPKNMERQDHASLGPKPMIRCAELAPRFPLVNFVPMHKWVVEKAPPVEESSEGEEGGGTTSVITAKDLLQDGDVVICVVDNFACRATVTAAAAELANVDVFHGGNDDGYFGSFYHYQRRNGADVTTNPLWKPEFADPSDRNPGEMSCEERARVDGGTQLIFTNMMVAAALGSKIKKIVIDNDRVEATDEFFIELDKGKALGSDRTAISSDEAPAESAETDLAEVTS